MSRPSTNPKDAIGRSKPGIHAIPPVALLHCGRGMEDGEVKYGLANWRLNEVSAAVYYNAAFRHFAAWWDGQQEAPDSGVHHLGHVMACCAIILDAEASGKLVDDRPSVPGTFAEMAAAMTRKKAEAAPASPRPVSQPSALTAPYGCDGLCEDEGCPHHGTPHICVPAKDVAAAIASAEDSDLGRMGMPQTETRGEETAETLREFVESALKQRKGVPADQGRLADMISVLSDHGAKRLSDLKTDYQIRDVGVRLRVLWAQYD